MPPAGAAQPGRRALDPAGCVPCEGLARPWPGPWKAVGPVLSPRVNGHDCRERGFPGHGRPHLPWGDAGAQSQPRPTQGTASGGSSRLSPSSARGTGLRVGCAFLLTWKRHSKGPPLGWAGGWGGSELFWGAPLVSAGARVSPQSNRGFPWWVHAATRSQRCRGRALCPPPASYPLPGSSGVILLKIEFSLSRRASLGSWYRCRLVCELGET